MVDRRVDTLLPPSQGACIRADPQTTTHSRIDLHSLIRRCLHYRVAGYLRLVLPTHPYPFSTYPGFAFPWSLEYFGLFTKSVAGTIPCALHQTRVESYTHARFRSPCPFTALEAWPKPVEEYGVLSHFGGNVVGKTSKPSWSPDILQGNVHPPLSGHA